ncbi:hypothetical protein [Streptomyces sp. N1]|nr:hypothetical protein [Streptomyces sp. N1]
MKIIDEALVRSDVQLSATVVLPMCSLVADRQQIAQRISTLVGIQK